MIEREIVRQVNLFTGRRINPVALWWQTVESTVCPEGNHSDGDLYFLRNRNTGQRVIVIEGRTETHKIIYLAQITAEGKIGNTQCALRVANCDRGMDCFVQRLRLDSLRTGRALDKISETLNALREGGKPPCSSSTKLVGRSKVLTSLGIESGMMDKFLLTTAEKFMLMLGFKGGIPHFNSPIYGYCDTTP